MTIDTKQFAGHTSGPWRVGTKYDDEICAAVSVHGVDRMQTLARTLGNADNARLIAAAPSLLAEVSRLQAANAELVAAMELAEATINRLTPPTPHNSTQGTRDVIRAAIAKAKA